LPRPEYNVKHTVGVFKSFLLQPPVLSIGDAKSEDVKQQNSASVQADQTYTHTQQSLYLCVQCGETVTTTGSVISHQVTAHPNKVFQSELCSVLFIAPRHYMTNIKNFLRVIQNIIELSHNIHANDSCSLQSPVRVEEIQPLFSNNDQNYC